MCGICGIFDFEPEKKIDPQDLKRMLQSIFHRGPDDEGIFTKENFGFGNRRLSIIDLEGGHQPIFNEDGSLGIVFNGEIYNFLRLKKDLLMEGHRFSTRTDTEVILHLYEDWEEKCLERLDGMFALAIFNFRKKHLFLARDPFGKKPLYWTINDNRFIFASEIKAILSLSGVKRVIDQSSLSKYFFYGYVPSPSTIFKGIKILSAGSFLTIDEDKAGEEKKFWEIDYSQKITNLSRDEIKKEIVVLLGKAVKKRLIADVPIGIFLSGGIDSSLIAALVPDRKIEAFTIGFEDKQVDESSAAREVAGCLGIKHNLEIFSNKEVLSILPKALELMDEPNADPSILPTHLVSAFARKKVKVVLSGDGGDESFAGYPKYLGHWLLENGSLGRLPIWYAVASLVGSSKGKMYWRYSSFPLYLRNQLWLSSLSLAEVKQLTGREVSFEDIERYHQIFNGKNPLDEAFFLDQKMTLVDQFLVKVDRASMAHELEVRCPFLDKDLVQFSAQIPFKLKVQGFKTKSLLREIAAEVLPKEIAKRPKKGFGVPLEKWLKNNLKDYVAEYTSLGRIKKEKILNWSIIADLLKKNNYHFVWKLLIFEIWVEKWLKN